MKTNYCENYFKELSANDPQRLIDIIKLKDMPPHLLTYAAEYIGWISDPKYQSEIILTLSDLLNHESKVVREGAMIGLDCIMMNYKLKN